MHPEYLSDLEYIESTGALDCLDGYTVLLTGATGMIGVCLIDALMHHNHKGGSVRVIACGRDVNKGKARLGDYFTDPYFSFLEQDVLNPFSKEVTADFIIPLASNTHPLAYSQYPIETIRINYSGCLHALDLAVRCGARVLYPSTVEIYGNASGEDVFTESYTGSLTLSTARSCYTESKRVCEALCQSYIAERGADIVIARLSRIFGPTVLASDTKASTQFIMRSVQGEDIILKSAGEQLFSYTYVADCVAAMLHLMVKGICGKAYNVSNPKCDVRLKEFAAICASASGGKVVFDLPSDAEKKGYSIASRAIMDNTLLVESGYTPHYSMEDAIRRTIVILKDEIR